MKIELLYFEGCPSYQTALKYLKEVIRENKLDVQVKMVKVASDEDALKSRFLGSPTIRVNGLDVDPGARESKDFSMCCRLYLEDGRIKEYPSKNLIRRAIEESLKRTGT
jgi:hypothetical protein